MATPRNFDQWWKLYSTALIRAAAQGDVLSTKKLAADCWSSGLAQLEVQLASGDSELFNQISPKIQALYKFDWQVTS